MFNTVKCHVMETRESKIKLRCNYEVGNKLINKGKEEKPWGKGARESITGY